MPSLKTLHTHTCCVLQHYASYCHFLFFIPQSATALELFKSALAEKTPLVRRILCFSSFENKPVFEAVNCMLTIECRLSQTKHVCTFHTLMKSQVCLSSSVKHQHILFVYYI